MADYILSFNRIFLSRVCCSRFAPLRNTRETRFSFIGRKSSSRLICYTSRKFKDANCTETLQSMSKPQQILLSGIQPTGRPHIGNYFGAINQWRQLQGRYGMMLIAIVDMHSITLPQDPQKLRSGVTEMLATLLACGLDHKHTVIFQQSMVAEHAQLCWILGCLTTLNKLEHLPQWKEKAIRDTEVPLGLFTYPVLQAADILLYKSTDVAVGDDQVKHLELARHLAKQFNSRYGKIFPLPRTITGEFKRIRSLRDPESKMSKSSSDPLSRIELLDSAEAIQEKLRKSVSDSTSYLSYDPQARPAIANLLELHAAIRGSSGKGEIRVKRASSGTGIDSSLDGDCTTPGKVITPQQLCEKYSRLNTLDYKMLLADELIEFLRPVREHATELLNDPKNLLNILAAGNYRAREVASSTYDEVCRSVGYK